jgi:hypothetical protein
MAAPTENERDMVALNSDNWSDNWQLEITNSFGASLQGNNDNFSADFWRQEFGTK